MKDYEHHPISDLFPLTSTADIKELAADIAENGLQFPIIIYEGKILDGRHRYEACSIAKIKPRFENYHGDDPMSFVLSANLRRRHLTDGQRAMIAAKMANMKQGERTDTIGSNGGSEPSVNYPKVSQSEAAEALDVSTHSVGKAAKILDASPKLTKQVEAGKISLNAAHKQVKEKEAEEEEVLDECDYPVPDALQDLWERRNEVESISKEVAALKNRFLALQCTDDLLWKGFEAQRAASFCENIHQALSAVRLFAVCIVCQGRARKSCAFCAGKGLISKFKWETQATREAKELRKQSLAMKGGKS